MLKRRMSVENSHSMSRLWLEVRDTDNKLLFRFDPIRDLVEIGGNGRRVLIDLSSYRDRAESHLKSKQVHDMIGA